MANYPKRITKISDLDTFAPLDSYKQLQNSVIMPYDYNMGSITSSGITTYSLPGAMLDYSFEHDMDFLKSSGLPQHEQERIFKKELAQKLVEKMIDDGHIVFTKQNIMEYHKIRFKAYTWVGNKDFIEQQRKNNIRR